MATTRATELGQLAKLVTVDSNGNSVISGTFDATLPASGVVAGVHGSASSVPIMSVTAQGIIDSVGSAPIVTANSLAFDSATGQLTLGFSDASNISQTLTLDPFTTADLTEGSNLYYTDARFDSAFGVKTTADLTEGSNLYYTDVRFDSAFGDKTTTNLIEGNNLYYTQGRFDSALGDKTTDNLTEGSNLYYTTARADSDAKAAISVTDAGGDGSLTYSAGTITYTGPSAAETRAHFSGGTGVDISSGVVSIGQNVDSSATVIFQTLETTGNVVVGGNLQVNGATTTVSSQNLQIEDNMFYLNQLESDGSPTIEVDVGFAANVNDTGSYAHTGFFRDATDATWKLFDGYTPEPDSDLDIDINHASFSYAPLQIAGLTTSGVTSTGDVGVTGNITVSGTVDGRDVAADGSKLDGIESGATADQTKADIDALNINADQVDGLEASQFLRSDTSDAMTGTLTVNSDTVKLYNSTNTNNTFLIAENTGAGNAGLQIKNQDGTWTFIANDRLRIIDGDASVERLSITSNGNVGINDTSPAYKLHSAVSTASSNYLGDTNVYALGITNENTTAGNAVAFAFGHGTYDYTSYIASIRQGTGANPWGDISIGGRPSDAAGFVDRLYIKGNTGNVGIGTTSPVTKLHVYGNSALSGGKDPALGNWGGDPFAVIGGFEGTGNHDGSDENANFPLAVISLGNNGGNTPAIRKNQVWITGGISGQAYNSAARWDLGRWENSGVDARSRLDLYLADDTQTWDHVMTWRADGSDTTKVGIGTTSPSETLDVVGKVVIQGGSGAWSDGGNQGGATGSIHLDPNSATDHYGSAITWGASDASNGTNAQAGIYVRSDGSYGTKMYLSTTDSYATGSKSSVKIDHLGHVSILRGNLYVPFIYDSNDTGYYVNPNGTSSMWNVNIRGDVSSTATGNQIFFWSNGSTTTSAIGFKSNGGNFSNPTGNGDGYNTYLTMDTAGRGWVFRRGTGGTDFSAAYTSGWILNNGLWQSNGSMRAPIFYDSNDTAYYCDPASTSRLNAIDFGDSSPTLTDDSNYLRITTTYGYINIGSGNSSYAHFNTDRPQFYFNNTIQVDGAGIRMYDTAADVRAYIFYDQANTAYYFDGSATGDSIRVAGDIVAYYSDERLKDREGNISGAIDKVSKLNGFYYRANKKAQELGYDTKLQVGVSAQEVEAVLPEVVKDAPIGQGYKTVKYDRMVPLLIEAIKEQQEIINKQSQDIDELKQLVKQLMENK